MSARCDLGPMQVVTLRLRLVPDLLTQIYINAVVEGPPSSWRGVNQTASHRDRIRHTPRTARYSCLISVSPGNIRKKRGQWIFSLVFE